MSDQTSTDLLAAITEAMGEVFSQGILVTRAVLVVEGVQEDRVTPSLFTLCLTGDGSTNPQWSTIGMLRSALMVKEYEFTHDD